MRTLMGLIITLAALMIFVMPVAARHDDSPVTICHHAGPFPSNWHTITVDDDALAAHLGHGDTLGPCTSTPTATPTSSPTQEEPTPTATPTGAPSEEPSATITATPTAVLTPPPTDTAPTGERGSSTGLLTFVIGLIGGLIGGLIVASALIRRR